MGAEMDADKLPDPDLGEEFDHIVPLWLYEAQPNAVERSARDRAQRQGLILAGEPRTFVVMVWDVAGRHAKPSPGRRHRATQAAHPQARHTSAVRSTA